MAEKGDINALKILNENYYLYPVSSAEFAEAVKWFGVYKYKPSIRNLIDSLDAASLNLSGAAYGSLIKIFDGAHPEKQGIEKAINFFTNLYEKNR